MSPIRIGVVGLGWWACETHIPNLLRVPGAAITTLCSRSPESIARGRKALDGKAEPLAFSDYDKFLDSDAADAVVICTPNYTHGAMTLAAVWAGKHVLSEKPLATHPAECRAIVEEAAGTGLVVQVGVELRYSDVAIEIRRLIAGGAIGELAILRCDIWRQWSAPGAWRADDAKLGGLFHELGIHYIDLLSFLAGTPPLWVTAAGGVKATPRDLDYAVTTLGYEGGAVAAIGMCLFVAGGGNDLVVEIIGTEGSLVGDIVRGTITLLPKGGEFVDCSPQRAGGKIFGFPGSLESVASFIECIRTGARPSADAATGEILCRACEAARRSAAAGGEKTGI